MSMLAPIILAALLSNVVLTDLRLGLIRNWSNLALFICGLGLNAVRGVEELLTSLLGGFLGGGILLLVAIAYRAIKKRDGLGMGDVKFMLGAGSWVLPHGIAPLLMISSVIALLAVMLSAAPRTGTQDHIAFGPFLSLGCFSVFCLQDLGLAPWLP